MKRIILLIAVLATASFICHSQVPTSGLVAWYPFNGNANDASGNGNNGTNNGASLTADRLGNANSAFSFNGSSDYIGLPFASSSFNQAITITAWVYRTKTSDGDDVQGIVSNDLSTNRGIVLCALPSSNLFLASVPVSQTIRAQPQSDLIPESTWHFIAMTYDNVNVKIYQDGVFKTSSPLTGNLYGDQLFTIGKDAYYTSSGRYWGGKIDDIRLYNRALSDSEILQLYNENSGSSGNVSASFIFDTKPPVVSLLNPNGGQTFSGNQTIPVNWTASDEQIATNPVTISMTGAQNGVYQTLQQNLPNTGTSNVLPLSISTQYAKMKASVKDKYGNVGSDVSDGTFTVTTSGFTSLTADFNFSPLQPNAGQLVNFNDASTGNPGATTWQWVFSDGICYSTQNPTHVFSQQGTYTVSLTVGNGTGTFITKTKTVTVGSNNYGIDLEIVETGGTQSITHVGYYYKWGKIGIGCGNCYDYFKWEKVTFLVETVNGKRIVHINQFIDKTLFDKQNEGVKKCISDFNDTIYLFDEAMNRVGHITFDYDYKQQKEFDRQAVLFFHNDAQVTANEYFPYGINTSFEYYNPEWKYFKKGEYPVSMLVPPNNKFLTQSTGKTPLLFIHGWEGTFEYVSKPDADRSKDELSYWFTTIYYVNGNNDINRNTTSFEGWQFYYPYNMDIPHIAMCLDYATDYLKTNHYPSKKIGLITHSMGALSTIEMITNPAPQNKSKMQNRFSKVLFIEPPLHGSSGANYYYKTSLGYIAEMLGALNYDHNGPCVKDMSMASDFMLKIQKERENNWIALNSANNSDRYKDFFVLMGTTPKWYVSDKGAPLHIIMWNEATNHHDGIVSMSSASLLDKQIGFATFHGNHSDGTSSQSRVRGKKSKQNIGRVDFIPEIIFHYFLLEDHLAFLFSLYADDDIKSIVTHEGQVFKPSVQGITLGNLNTPGYSTGVPDVIYQTGTLNFEMTKSTGKSIYTAFYNETNKDLILKPYYYDAISTPRGYNKIGCFEKNEFSTNKDRYFFNQKSLKTIDVGFPPNPQDIYVPYGTAMYLKPGNDNKIRIFRNESMVDDKYTRFFTFNYCQTNYCQVGPSFNYGPSEIDTTNNQTDYKTSQIVSWSTLPVDTVSTTYWVDDQAEFIKFEMSAFDAQTFSVPVTMKVQLPDGTIADTSSAVGTWNYNSVSGNHSLKVNNPMVGRWKVWATSQVPEADTISFSSVAMLLSSIYAYMINDTNKASMGGNFQLEAGLEMDTLSLADSLVTMATVTKPNGDTLLFNMTSSKVAIDTAFKFTQSFLVDTVGYYNIKINMDGVYDGHRFERVLFHQLEASDTAVILSLPPVTLTQNKTTASIDLREFAHNYPCSYDTLEFLAELVPPGTGTNTITYNLIDSTRIIHLSTNLADTGSIALKITMLMPGQSVADTIHVTVGLPDFIVFDDTVNKLILYPDSSLIATCKLKNQGNLAAGGIQFKYFLSDDPDLSTDDVNLGGKTIDYLDADSLVVLNDTLSIPPGTAAGAYYLLFAADPDTSFRELNDSTNNLAWASITINCLPVVTVKFFPEGLYNTAKGRLNKAQDVNANKYPGNIADLATVYLANSSPPYQILQTFTNVPFDTNGMASVTIPQTFTATCYIIIKHRNSLETWSMVPVAVDSLMMRYDFTQNPNAAFGGNLKNIGSNYLLYSGDINQDGAIDAKDLIMVGNDKALGATGYSLTDLNGDGVVNDADVQLLQGNASEFIMRKKPE